MNHIHHLDTLWIGLDGKLEVNRKIDPAFLVGTYFFEAQKDYGTSVWRKTYIATQIGNVLFVHSAFIAEHTSKSSISSDYKKPGIQPDGSEWYP